MTLFGMGGGGASARGKKLGVPKNDREVVGKKKKKKSLFFSVARSCKALYVQGVAFAERQRVRCVAKQQ